MKRLLILIVRAYRLLTGWTPPVCRYTPSCSAYAIGALDRHGARRGTLLAARRVLRCHPWRAGGYDPVPEAPASGEAEPTGDDSGADRACGADAPSRSGMPVT